MARITNREVENMQQGIIDDLYLKTAEDLNKRKEELVAKNRQMLLEKYQPYIDKLPKNMLNKKEINWLNKYHSKEQKNLFKFMNLEEKANLTDACSPI